MKISKKTKKQIGAILNLIIEILKLIKKGIPEKDAVKTVAHNFDIPFDKVNKLWKKRKKFPFIT